jgi:hypothetical protein
MLALSSPDLRQNAGGREERRCLGEGLQRTKEGLDIAIDIPLDQLPHGPDALDIGSLKPDEGFPALDVLLGQDEQSLIGQRSRDHDGRLRPIIQVRRTKR